MHKYSPVYKPNQLICGAGQVAIITGWTVKNFVAKYLDPSEYAVVGQLYSPTRGISFLVRNLLLNPQVRFLVVLNATREDANAGGCQCLLDFFAHGCQRGVSDTGKECWVISSAVTGFIDQEISFAALETLRKSITCQEVKTVNEAIALAKSLDQSLPAWGEPIQFPLVESLPTVLPGERYGHRIEGKTIAETWVKIIHRIKTTGTIRPTGYDGQWQELIDLVAVVTDEPKDFYFPEPNYLPVDRAAVDQYLPQMLEDAPYQEGVKYTYGQRMRSWFGKDQIEEVIQKLIKEIDAASAVINLWDSGGNLDRRADGSSDHSHGGSPCLNHVWLRVVDGEISLTATLRSNDMFAAWVSNAMGLRALQWHILEEINRRSNLNLKIAPLITISQSAHIYDDCWENADRLIATQYQKIIQKQDYSDPVGNFIIEVENCEVTVTQTHPNQEVVAIYSDNNILRLVREIVGDNPSIDPAHAAYLGIEIARAKSDWESSRVYRQDG
jgi:thymidylate synthase